MASSTERDLPAFDVARLRAANRDLPVQFLLRWPPGDVHVEAVLRWLPGRRAVLLVRAADGTRRVLKLHLREVGRAMAAERDGLAALASAGLAVPRLLAEERLGEAHGQGDAGVQQLEYIEEARALVDAWPSLADTERVHWLRELAAGIARLHAAGARPRDPHLGNFLLQSAAGAPARLVALDGGGIGITRAAPSPAECVADLALLHAQLPPDDDAWVRDAADAYARAGGVAMDVHAVQRAIDVARARRLRLILRKALRDCSEFAVHQAPRGWTVQVRALAPRLRALLAAPDQAIASGKLLKDGNTATVARVAAGDGSHWVCKRYNIKGTLHRLSRAWRRTRGEHSWLAAQRLAALGIATAMPVALHVERSGPFRGRAFLWMRDVQGDALDVLAGAGKVDDALRLRVANLVVRLHAAGLVHGDLKASNLLVEQGEPVLVDLDALVQLPPGIRRDRAQARDRARFLANWAEGDERAAWAEALDVAGQQQRERRLHRSVAGLPPAVEPTRGTR